MNTPLSHADTPITLRRTSRRTKGRRGGLPPGPRGLPGLGVAPFIARDPYRYLPRLAKRYGDVVHVPVPGATMILVSHPDHVNHVSNRHADRYSGRPEVIRHALSEPPRFPDFIAVLDGDAWRRRRKQLNPRFTSKGLAEIDDLIGGAVREGVDYWARWADTGKLIDLQHEFHLITMSVLLRSMFSTPADRVSVEKVVTEFEATLRGVAWRMITGNAPRWIPQPYARRTRVSSDWIATHLDDMVARRRRQPTDNGDLLNRLLELRFDDGSAFTEDELRAELRGLTIGGYDTTANALAWTFAMLTTHRSSAEAAYAEVDALGGRPVDHDTLPSLPWLQACFDEGQRLQGFPFNARGALVDDEIDGYHIPAGATVIYSGYGIQRDPRFWRDPDTFDPSRFLNDDINKYAYLAFGVGPRRCMGVRMGYMVGLYVLATALQRYRFELKPGFQIKHHYNFANMVKGGIPVTIHRRNAHA